MANVLEDFKSAFSRRDNGLNQLILINVIVFCVFQVLKLGFKLSLNGPVYDLVLRQFTLPADLYVLAYRPWTIFTYFFLHEDFFHILFNMLFLYYFGNLISEYLGNRRLVNVYILGGLAGGIAYLAAYNLIPYFRPELNIVVLLGASGAVYAAVVAAATLLPDYTFNLLLIGPVRIVYIAIFYVAISFFEIAGRNSGGNLAHLGGALMGYIFIRQLKAGNDWGKPIDLILNTFTGMFKPKSKVRVTYKQDKKAVVSSKIPNQDEIDNILDKISRSGYDSLSKDEKQKLFKASQT